MGTDQYLTQESIVEEMLPWAPEDALGNVAARFERVVRAQPEAIALKNGDLVVSYDKLNAAANRIAHALLARLGEGSVPVASLLSDRVHVIQTLLGVLKAGKIHTPLAPGQPASRLQLILADAEPSLVLVDGAQLALAAQLGLPRERLLDLDTLDQALPEHDPCLCISPESFGYLFYTSGSTGRPKGVVHKHRVVMADMHGRAVSPGLRFSARTLLMASPGYVMAVWDILPPLLNGATLCPFALEAEGLASLRDCLMRERIMQFAITASTFRHFMATLHGDDRFPAIKFIELFGEPVLRKDFEQFQQHFEPHAVFTTELGSTEAGILSELYLNQKSAVMEPIMPAGYVVTIDREVYIVDEASQRVGTGVAGEIVVKSRNLGEYWRNPELNARAFRPDPEGSDQRIFHTGDMGLLRADGMLEYHGRKDFQVKVRGNRLELGEIEMALFDLGNIREAVVVARPDADGETRLIAYVVPERRKDEGGRRKAEQGLRAAGQILSAGELRRGLAESLPAYMVPAAFVILDALPMTASGKIDRAQLPAPALSRADGGTARDTLEAQLAQIWEALLHVPDVGTNEDFFELGGNSLLAMRLFADIQQRLGRTLPLSILFQASTIAGLAALIRAEKMGATGDSCLVPIQTRGARRPFFLAAGGLGGDGELLVYARLARYLGTEQPFYGLRTRAALPGRKANDEVEAIAAGHVAEIRAVQPSGPYLLGGECIGGVVAVEMARQLRAQGEAVSMLCLLDTVRPTWRAWLDSRRTLLANRWQQTVRSATYAVRHATRALRGRPPLPAPRAVRPNFAYAKATARYRPQRSAERITLLVNQEYHRRNPSLGWQPLAGGGIEAHVLPGTHETYIRENVQAAGECLRDCLERAQGRQD